MVKAREILGKARGILNIHGPFGDRAEQRTDIDFLPRLALLKTTRHLTDEDQQRRGVLRGDMQPRQGIGTAWATGHEANPWASGGLGIGLGHHRRTAFLATHHQGDVGSIVQRVENRQEAFAGHREHPVHTIASE